MRVYCLNTKDGKYSDMFEAKNICFAVHEFRTKYNLPQDVIWQCSAVLDTEDKTLTTFQH